MLKKSKEMALCPCVFVAGDSYTIMLPVKRSSLMWVKVGDKCYYDEFCGVMRSETSVHRMTVPQAELDKYGEYTIFEREIINRRAYFPLLGPPKARSFRFYPVKGGKVRAYQIADAHNDEVRPLAAARAFGDIDFLILNGDIPNHSGSRKNFGTVYRLCSELTRGELPIVFARGNHDMRGKYAESYGDYVPTHNGNTYYTFRLGSIWGMVLDSGEDKSDANAEYGGTICCHEFRLRQTQFIKDVAENADREFAAPGVTHKIVVAHIPFMRRCKGEFDIEREVFGEWSRLLEEKIKPDVFIAGHVHKIETYTKENAGNALFVPCPVVVGTEKNARRYASAGFNFCEGEIGAVITDNYGNFRPLCTIDVK